MSTDDRKVFAMTNDDFSTVNTLIDILNKTIGVCEYDKYPGEDKCPKECTMEMKECTMEMEGKTLGILIKKEDGKVEVWSVDDNGDRENTPIVLNYDDVIAAAEDDEDLSFVGSTKSGIKSILTTKPRMMEILDGTLPIKEGCDGQYACSLELGTKDDIVEIVDLFCHIPGWIDVVVTCPGEALADFMEHCVYHDKKTCIQEHVMVGEGKYKFIMTVFEAD